MKLSVKVWEEGVGSPLIHPQEKGSKKRRPRRAGPSHSRTMGRSNGVLCPRRWWEKTFQVHFLDEEVSSRHLDTWQGQYHREMTVSSKISCWLQNGDDVWGLLSFPLHLQLKVVSITLQGASSQHKKGCNKCGLWEKGTHYAYNFHLQLNRQPSSLKL